MNFNCGVAEDLRAYSDDSIRGFLGLPRCLRPLTAARTKH